MGESKKTQVATYRISDEVKEKIKEIALSTGRTQQDTLQLLVNAYYMQTEKAELPEHAASIEEFESCTTRLIQMFTESLRSNHNMKESVMKEFSATLESKDQTIIDLQDKLKASKEKEEIATAQAKDYADAVAKLEADKAQLEAQLKDKTDLNKSLDDSLKDLKLRFADLAGQITELGVMRSNLAQIKSENDSLRKSLSDTENSLKQANTSLQSYIEEMKKHEADALSALQQKVDLEKERALLELEQKLKKEKQEAIDKYQQKYFDLLEQQKRQQ